MTEKPPADKGPSKAQDDSHIESVLALSTGHMPNSMPKFGDVRVVEFALGYILFMVLDPEEVEEWLRPIMAHAIDHECTLILFDRDAMELPEFKVYDW